MKIIHTIIAILSILSGAAKADTDEDYARSKGKDIPEQKWDEYRKSVDTYEPTYNDRYSSATYGYTTPTCIEGALVLIAPTAINIQDWNDLQIIHKCAKIFVEAMKGIFLLAFAFGILRLTGRKS